MPESTDPMDYAKAARLFSEIQADMIHRENSELCGDEFYAEVLRRLHERIGYAPQKAPEPSHAGCHAALEATERDWRRQYEKLSAALITAAASYAAAIRHRCTEQNVPSRLRREGALLAASWLDGQG